MFHSSAFQLETGNRRTPFNRKQLKIDSSRFSSKLPQRGRGREENYEVGEQAAVKEDSVLSRALNTMIKPPTVL